MFTGCSAIVAKNDVLSDTDEDFTHGTEFVSYKKYKDAPESLKKIASWLPGIYLENGVLPKLSEHKPTHVRGTLGQHIYTPQDLKTSELIEDDNPYAGWLFGEVKRERLTKDIRNATGITVGIIGPWSGAEAVQKFVHKDLGLGTPPKGWNNQLDNEPGLVLEYDRDEITFRKEFLGQRLDSVSSFMVRAGNIYTDLNYNKIIRFGYNPPELDGYQGKFSLFGYSGLGASLVARNIFYDGNTWEDSHSVGSEPAVGRVIWGAGLQVYGFEIVLDGTLSTPEHKQQDNVHTIWMLRISRALDATLPDLF